MEEVREIGAPSSYLTELLHNSNFTPEYKWVKPLSPRPLWSNPVSSSSDNHRASSLVASPRRELPSAATCRPFLLGTFVWVLRPKPVNPPPMVLRPKPLNPLASSVLRTHPPPLDTCHRLDSINTVTPMSSCTCRCPKCQPPWLVTQPPGPSVQASCLPFIAPGPSARHVSTWPSSHRRPPLPSSTPAQHKPRDMSHT
jgi:hypothetical protein